MAPSNDVSVGLRAKMESEQRTRSSGVSVALRKAWHVIAPAIFREIRLLNARCLPLIPNRLARYRFVARAARRRLFGNVGPLAMPTPLLDRPIFVRPFSSDVAVAVEMLAFGDYEYLRSLDAAPKTILDLGANIGLSVRLWQMWFPDATVLALEPNAATADIARSNIKLGARPEAVTVVEAAINNQSGTVYLCTDDQPWADHLVDQPTASTVAVRGMTVPECLAMMSTSSIDLFKCDIEGAEAPLFGDCRSWIDSVKTLVVETHHPYSLALLLSDLNRNGSRLILRKKIQQETCCVAFFSQEKSQHS